MSSKERKPSSIRSNADLIALALIITFAATGSAMAGWIHRMRIDPVPEVVRPHIMQIREDTRQAAREVRTDIRNEMTRANREMQGAMCDMRKEVREAGRESGRELRNAVHQLRDEIRRETREFFRQFRSR